MSEEKPWVAAMDGMKILAVQHGCGVGGLPINCALDEQNNWFCPHCMTTYGAAVPLEGWAKLVVAEKPAP